MMCSQPSSSTSRQFFVLPGARRETPSKDSEHSPPMPLLGACSSEPTLLSLTKERDIVNSVKQITAGRKCHLPSKRHNLNSHRLYLVGSLQASLQKKAGRIKEPGNRPVSSYTFLIAISISSLCYFCVPNKHPEFLPSDAEKCKEPVFRLLISLVCFSLPCLPRCTFIWRVLPPKSWEEGARHIMTSLTAVSSGQMTGTDFKGKPW